MEESKTGDKRPVGSINIHDARGYGFIPQIVRNELGVNGKARIPFFLDANVVLLVRKDASRADVLKGIEILKEDLRLRWKELENQSKEASKE